MDPVGPVCADPYTPAPPRAGAAAGAPCGNAAARPAKASRPVAPGIYLARLEVAGRDLVVTTFG